MKSCIDGIGYIRVRDMRQICAVRIDVNYFFNARFAPIVSNSGGNGDIAKDLLQLLSLRSETWQIFTGNPDLNWYSDRLASFQTSRINNCSRNLAIQFPLQKGKEKGRIVSIFRS